MLMFRHNFIKILSLAGLISITSMANAETLSPEDALGRALPQIRRNISSTNSNLKLVYTENVAETHKPAVYVFSRSDNYFLVSADDNAESLLGYADEAFDPANIPPSLKWWLGEYARQIATSVSHPSNATMRVPREAINPMVKTLWDQGEPYNIMCPVYSGERAVTGCAATAMAQVMKYFNYPDKGIGTHSYRSNGKLLSMNFADTEFDWQNMLDRYNTNSTDTQKNAVAKLMYACGVSIDMQYSPYESGATDIVVPYALVNYFNYDKGIRYFMRDYYTTAQWEELIYNQLATCGPVQYSGVSNEGGHSFVCDGYNTDGYFHFNWGWSGMSDGYYLLTALDPEQQGIGGSLSGFNFSQSVIGNVRKPEPESVIYPELYILDRFEIPSASFRIGSQITVNAMVANYSYETTRATLGLKFVDSETGATTYTAGSTNVQLQQRYYVERYFVSMPIKASGTYIVTPAMRDANGTWYDIPVKKAYASSYTFTVNNGNVVVSPNKVGALRGEDIELNSRIYLGQDFNLCATIRNPTQEDLYASIAPALVSDNNILAIGEYMFVSLNAGDSKSIDYIGGFEHTASSWTPTGGDYKLCLINTDTNEAISDFIDVTVYNKPANTIISVSNFSIEGGLTNVDAANVKFTGRVQCRMGYFGGRLDVAIFPNNSESNTVSIANLQAKPLFLSFGRFGDLDASGRLMGVEIGKSYIAAVFNDMTQVSNGIVFTVGNDSSGIGSIYADNETSIPATTDGIIAFGSRVTKVNIYALSGTLLHHATNVESIDISDLSAGIYLVETIVEGNSHAKKVNRIVKR